MNATVIHFVAKEITTLAILFIALAILESTAVLPTMTLGSLTLSDATATQISIAAHNKLGEKTQIAHLATPKKSVAMRNFTGKTTTAFAIAPKNAAQGMTTIITQNSVCATVILNAVS
jgi:hypothetical protein